MKELTIRFQFPKEDEDDNYGTWSPENPILHNDDTVAIPVSEQSTVLSLDDNARETTSAVGTISIDKSRKTIETINNNKN
jgi:hypothetical protein